ncbi:MAG: hypothetical protein QW374_04645 [Candidatus Bathyarchaeia archaeon]|nr:hypothetical protein [Candidatus Bathyarchaeota archaeon]
MSKRFEDVFEEAVDRGLSIVGNIAKEVVLHLMSEFYGVKKGCMGSDPCRVHDALVRILGDGAKFAEKSIVSALCELIGLEPVAIKGKGFLEIIEEARRIYEEKINPSI